jgi:hypothetical protein
MAMERWYSVPKVAEVMGCCYDTARERMKEMDEVVNVGSQKRQQLMVPESSVMDWLRNHRMIKRAEITAPKRNIRLVSNDGKLARMDRRTGKLKAI